MSDNKCGTYAGWNLHQREGTPKCDPCLTAAADYMSAWRRRSTSRTVLDAKEVGRARWRAITLLIAAHPEEFDRLFAAEREARAAA